MLNKVLCVDDDPVTLALLRMMLVKCSFAKEVVTGADGSEALDILQSGVETGVDLIFLDLNMPVKSGWDVLDEMQSWEPCKLEIIKVVILSSTLDPNDACKAKQYREVVCFVNKPLTAEKIDWIKNSLKVPTGAWDGQAGIKK